MKGSTRGAPSPCPPAFFTRPPAPHLAPRLLLHAHVPPQPGATTHCHGNGMAQHGTTTNQVRTVDPDKAIGKPMTLWCAFAKLYERNGDLPNARIIFQKATEARHKYVDDLAQVRLGQRRRRAGGGGQEAGSREGVGGGLREAQYQLAWRPRPCARQLLHPTPPGLAAPAPAVAASLPGLEAVWLAHTRACAHTSLTRALPPLLYTRTHHRKHLACCCCRCCRCTASGPRWSCGTATTRQRWTCCAVPPRSRRAPRA